MAASRCMGHAWEGMAVRRSRQSTNPQGNRMKTKNEYIDSLAAELKEWGVQLDLLGVKADNAKAFAKLRYAEELKVLHAQQDAAAAKMEELEAASGDAWAAVKGTADIVWNDLRTGMASAAAAFK